ncbi:hypothetical protein EVAR_21230_1 [Eumeta japonica]|uniref:Uncharacterized protein n=1 Tax=Eumeta variegata TaxID=151549 RepID=A0A4C1UNQ5_EUMVA|nr:hypothetical protein EVAR_21230_1 [Eumeta japonica]
MVEHEDKGQAQGIPSDNSPRPAGSTTSDNQRAAEERPGPAHLALETFDRSQRRGGAAAGRNLDRQPRWHRTRTITAIRAPRDFSISPRCGVFITGER